MKSTSSGNTTASPRPGRYETDRRFTQEDLEAFLAQAFGRSGRGSDWGATGHPMHGRDMQYTPDRQLRRRRHRHHRRLALPDGKTLDVRIPPGTEDGHVLRLRGQGGPGFNGAPAGDALIEIAVAPDPRFHRDGDDIVTDVPVSSEEAVLGTSLEVPTVHGPVRAHGPARIRHRHAPAAARQGHPPRPPVRAVAGGRPARR